MESRAGEVVSIAEYKHETIQNPTFKEAMQVVLSPQTLTLAACYVCSLGAELAINSILGAYYLKNFPKLGQTGSGRWAAMFGPLNVFFRPAGGFIGDSIYKYTNGSLWAKKAWIHFVDVITGLIAGMAFFLEAGNGANLALVTLTASFPASPAHQAISAV